MFKRVFFFILFSVIYFTINNVNAGYVTNWSYGGYQMYSDDGVDEFGNPYSNDMMGLVYGGLNGEICPDTDASDTGQYHIKAADNPHVFDTNLKLKAGCVLRIEPGSKIFFKNGANFIVSGNLQAIGTATNPILFTTGNDFENIFPTRWNDINSSSNSSTDEPKGILLTFNKINVAPGNWGYFHFNGTSSSASVLDYVDIKYGGSSSYSVYSSYGDVTIKNSTISDSASDCFYAYSGGFTLDNNTFNNCGGEGVVIYSNSTHTVTNNTISNSNSYGLYIQASSSTYSGNIISGGNNYGIYNTTLTAQFSNNQVLNNALPIHSMNIEPFLVSSNTTITGNGGSKLPMSFNMVSTTAGELVKYAGYDYNVIYSSTIDATETLTIQPGTIFKFEASTISLTINGNLQAVGTNANNIVFTSKNDNSVGQAIGNGSPLKGDWNYINIGGTNNPSVFDYTQIKYGGYSSYNLYFYSSIAQLTNSTITDSKTDCLYIYGGSPTIQNNTFNNCGNKGLNIYSSTSTINNNNVTNANGYGIYLNNTSINISNNIIDGGNNYGLYNDSLTATFSNNQIINNALPVYSKNIEPFLVSSNNTISGNSGSKMPMGFNMVSTTAGELVYYPGYDYNVIITSTIDATETLTINPGTVFKFEGSSIGLTVNGNLQAIGTSTGNIVFTSKNDNSLGQTIGTGSPISGDWSNLKIQGTNNPSVLDYTQIKYGGYSSYSLYFYSTNVSFTNSVVTDSKSDCLYLYGGAPVIQNSTFNNCGAKGIYLYSSTATVDNNNITNSNSYGIHLSSNTNINVSNNIIDGGNNYGIYNESLTATFNDNQIINNALPVYSRTIEPFLVSSNNTISGNGGNYMPMGFNMVSTFSGELINYSGYDYNVIWDSTIDATETLKINPGTIFKFETSSIGLTVNGNLNAIGTSTGNIIFTSKHDDSVGHAIGTQSPAPGNWSKIMINASSSSVFDYTQIKYGGNVNAGIYIAGGSTQLTNSTISHSKNDCVYVYGGTHTIENNTIDTCLSDGIYVYSSTFSIDNNTITGSSGYGLYIGASTNNISVSNNVISSGSNYGIYNVSYTSSFSNNQVNNNALSVYSRNIEPFLVSSNTTISGNSDNVLPMMFNMVSTTNGVLRKYDGYDYNPILNSTIDSGETLTIQPGTIFKFNPNISLTVNGNLQSVGDTNNHIIYTSINDNSVGQLAGTGNPAEGDWGSISFSNSGTNGSQMSYNELKYGGYGSYIVYVYLSSMQFTNNLIAFSKYNGLYQNNSTTIIKNNIFYKNLTNGLFNNGGSPDISHNLYYLNGTASSNVAIDANSIEADPLFVDEIGFELQTGSPAINKGDDTFFGNHPYSGDRYDIGVNEYTGFYDLNYGVSLTGVLDRQLDYEWSFSSLPAGATAPVLSTSTGTINTDGNVYTNFTLKKLGNYSIKFLIKEGETIVGEGTNNFTVTN